MTSGSILSLSTWSRSTLDHFCSESMMSQGRDMSTTNTAKQSDSDLAETANLRRPLWYRSPSRIHTLQRVKSRQDKQKNALLIKTHTHKKTSAVELTVSVFIMDTQVQVLQSPSFLIVFSPFKFGHECSFAWSILPCGIHSLLPRMWHYLVMSVDGMAYRITHNVNTANALNTLLQTNWLLKFYFVYSVLVTGERRTSGSSEQTGVQAFFF